MLDGNYQRHRHQCEEVKDFYNDWCSMIVRASGIAFNRTSLFLSVINEF